MYSSRLCAVEKIDSKSSGFSSSTLTLLVPGDDFFGRTVKILMFYGYSLQYILQRLS